MLTLDRMVQDLMVLGLDTRNGNICRIVNEFLDAEDGYKADDDTVSEESLQNAYRALKGQFFASFPKGI